MHGRLAATAFLITSATTAIANDIPESGYMYGLTYSQAKAACGVLPDDLEADYAKSMELLKTANPDFEKTYVEGLTRKSKKTKELPPEEKEEACNQGQVSLRVSVKLVRLWFPGAW